jgi:undecaprenyl-diphosphatase
MRSARFVSFGLLLALVIAFALLTEQVVQHRFLPWDLALALELQAWRTPGFHELMLGISYFGNGWKAWATTISFGLGLILSGRGREGGILLSGVGLGSLASSLLKSWVGRPRPTEDLLQVWIHLPNQSYPSGHVVLYVSLFGFLLYLVLQSSRPVRLRRILAILLAIPVLLVGLSRVYLGAHWPSDVAGGYLVGAFWLILMIFAHLRFGAGATADST